MAATAYGLIRTVTPGPNDPPRPNGTIFDRLHDHGISWLNYFSDAPIAATLFPPFITEMHNYLSNPGGESNPKVGDRAELRVDVDQSRGDQPPLGADRLPRLVCRQRRRDRGDLATGDRDVHQTAQSGGRIDDLAALDH